MQKYTYTIRTLSSLILSPRSNTAFYEELGTFDSKALKLDEHYINKEKLRIIYPFYQYGEYQYEKNQYMQGKAQYYIPGSSVKGALCQGEQYNMMADDVPVSGESIVLRNLYKTQFLDDPTKTNFDAFFENIGVEMIPARTPLCGELYVEDQEAFTMFLKQGNQKVKQKTEQMLSYIRKLNQQCSAQKDFCNKLRQMDQSLSSHRDKDNLFLFGGSKGLLHSIILADTSSINKFPGDDHRAALFLDRETMLPHGLVEIDVN